MRLSEELFAKGHLLFTLIRGLSFITEEDIRQCLKKYRISYPAFRVLWILYFDKNMTMTDLAYIAQANISNVYRQLIKLREEEFVIIENGADARIKEVSLTEKGRIFVYDILKVNSNATDLQLVSLLEKIPKEDLDKFIEVGSILSSELIGQKFTNWGIRTANYIMEK